MLNFKTFIKENMIEPVKEEPNSKTALEAKKLKLNYIGFGRYSNKSGRVTHVVHNDKLVKVDLKDGRKKNAAKTYIQSNRESKKWYAKKQLDAKKYNQALIPFYTRDNFTKEQIAAIKYYSDSFDEINKHLNLNKEKTTTISKKNKEKTKEINQAISDLDKAFEKTSAPFDFHVYSGVGDNYKLESFQKGQKYNFRSYKSTSLNITQGVDTSKNEAVILQVKIPTGAKGIYTDKLAKSQGDMEFLLPRNSRIKIVSEPKKVQISNSDKPSDKGLYYHVIDCELVNNED